MKSVGHKELIAMLQRFQNRKEYAKLKKSCVSAVTEWRWATSLMLPELPHEEIVRGFKPPKWSKKQPGHGSLHGLDADGRIRCMRGDERTKPDEQVFEQFLIYEDSGFWCIYFDNDTKKALLRVKWFEMKGDRWLRSLEIGYYGVRECVLHWESDRLVKYTQRDWSGISASNPKAAAKAKFKEAEAPQVIYSYSYAADSELEQVTEAVDLQDGDPPRPEVKYQRIPKGVTLNLLLQQAEDLLVAEIPKTIRAAKVREAVYGLLLQFTGVDTDPDGFAPPMFLATDSLRKRWLLKHPKDFEGCLWSAPFEGGSGVVSLSCDNPLIDSKLHLIFQLTVVQASPTNYSPVRKMFQRVCPAQCARLETSRQDHG